MLLRDRMKKLDPPRGDVPIIPTAKEPRDWKEALDVVASRLTTLVGVVEASDAPTKEAESVVDAAAKSLDALARMFRIAAEGRDWMGVISRDRERRGRPPFTPNPKGAARQAQTRRSRAGCQQAEESAMSDGGTTVTRRWRSSAWAAARSPSQTPLRHGD